MCLQIHIETASTSSWCSISVPLCDMVALQAHRVVALCERARSSGVEQHSSVPGVLGCVAEAAHRNRQPLQSRTNHHRNGNLHDSGRDDCDVKE